MARIWGVLLVGVFMAVGVLALAPQAEGVGTVKVCGSGYGHGVGLSQYGAYGRAKAGQGYARILKTYYRNVSLKQYSSNPYARVMLGQKNLDGSLYVTVRSGSRARLRNLATNGTVGLGPATYRVRYLSGRRLYQVTNASAGRPVGSYTGPVRFERVSGSLLAYGGKRYRGMLLAKASGASLYLVNQLRLEDYVRGVVTNEMPSSWASEALKSQAVAARSYARATKRGGTFDFYADTRDQVYGGASSETASTNRAVSATARIAAVYGGKPVKAFFYSSNGGYSEDSAYVFGSSPYLKAVRDTDAARRSFEARVGSPWTRWSGTLDLYGSSRLGVGRIRGVRVLNRSPSGRATKVRVVGTRGTKTISGEYNVRYGLKSNGLRRADGSSYPAGDLPSARVRFGSACG